MPIEDYGGLMRSAAWAPASVPGAYQHGVENAQRNALFDYKFKQAQEQDAASAAEEAAWEQAVQARDIQTMLQIDPDTTQLLQKHWESERMAGLGDVGVYRKPMEVPQEAVRPQVQRDGGYSYLFDPSKGVIPGSVQEPQRAPIGGGGFGDAPSGYRFQPDGNLAPIPGGPADMGGPGGRKAAQPLRKEFDGQQAVKDYKTVLPLIVSARQAPNDGYGDLQLIYTVGKVLDPNSVVREGELALTIAAGSPIERILGTSRFVVGQSGRLTPELRKQLLGMLNERALPLKAAYEQERNRYATYAKDQGMDPLAVVGPHAASAYSKPQAPQAAPANSAARQRANSYYGK